MKKHLPILLFLYLLTSPLLGQDNSTPDYSKSEPDNFYDVLYLNDGTILKGEVLDIAPDETLTFAVLNENKIKLHRDSFYKTVPALPNHFYFNEGQSFRNRGVYGTLSFAASFSSDISNSTKLAGVHLNISVGKMINKVLAVGIGTGIESYFAVPRNLQFIPLYAEVRGFHLKKKISPYYGLGVGIGFPIDLENRFNQEDEYFKKGLLLKPVLGLRFASKSKFNCFFEMGYRIQKTQTRYERNLDFSFFNSQQTPDYWVKEDISFRRLTYTIGLLF